MMGIFTFGIAIRAGIWFHFIAPIMAATPQKGYWSFFARLLYYPTYARLDGLMIGVAIALVYRLRPTLWRRLKAYGNSALVTGIFTLALGLLLAKDKENSWIGATFAYPLVSLGFGAMVFSALAEGSFISRIRVPGAQACATLAFSFYLIHKEMIHWVLDHATGWGLNPTGIWTFLLSAGVSVLASITLYSLVEYPFLLLRDYYVINSADSRARGTHAEKEAKAYG
jgi:peptidoglycan/LPS O-acetylase OafA/YrhL